MGNIKENLLVILQSINDLEFINSLKRSFVKSKNYEMAAFVREYQKENFPESESYKTMYNEATGFSHALSFCDIKISRSVSYLILQVAKKYNETGGDFAISDAVDITTSLQNEDYNRLKQIS